MRVAAVERGGRPNNFNIGDEYLVRLPTGEFITVMDEGPTWGITVIKST